MHEQPERVAHIPNAQLAACHVERADRERAAGGATRQADGEVRAEGGLRRLVERGGAAVGPASAMLLITLSQQ